MSTHGRVSRFARVACVYADPETCRGPMHAIRHLPTGKVLETCGVHRRPAGIAAGWAEDAWEDVDTSDNCALNVDLSGGDYGPCTPFAPGRLLRWFTVTFDTSSPRRERVWLCEAHQPAGPAGSPVTLPITHPVMILDRLRQVCNNGQGTSPRLDMLRSARTIACGWESDPDRCQWASDARNSHRCAREIVKAYTGLFMVSGLRSNDAERDAIALAAAGTPYPVYIRIRIHEIFMTLTNRPGDWVTVLQQALGAPDTPGVSWQSIVDHARRHNQYTELSSDPHRRGWLRMPHDMPGDTPAGQYRPAWVCCGCGQAEPTEYMLSINHGCCRRYHGCTRDRDNARRVANGGEQPYQPYIDCWVEELPAGEDHLDCTCLTDLAAVVGASYTQPVVIDGSLLDALDRVVVAPQPPADPEPDLDDLLALLDHLYPEA